MKYFSIDELCASDTARTLKISNTPSPMEAMNLTLLVENVLDPLRQAFSRPIYINSGYRSPKLNKAVKGAPTSQHMSGEAADITAGSRTLNKLLYELVLTLGLPFDQLINEKPNSKGEPKWIHISHRATDNRHQAFTIK